MQDYVIKSGGADKILHFGTKVTSKLEIHISFQDEQNQYKIILQPTENDELVPELEKVYFWDKEKYSSPYQEIISRDKKEAGISVKSNSKVANFVRDHLDSWRLYHFHDTSSTSPMKKRMILMTTVIFALMDRT